MKFFENNDLVIIAEIGVNHEGDLSQAKNLLQLAAAEGVDYVKFQSYTANRLASANDPSRLQRVSKFALSKEDFRELANLAKTLNVNFLSTPITEDWVDYLDNLCNAFKIASGDITFRPVIQKAAKTGKTIILSTGTATLDEIDQAINWVKEEIGAENLSERLILMHCVSAYPTPIEEANILSIPFLKERYGLEVGYSNHVIGISASLAAVALGANVVELHFTDCKEGREFRDHALSVDANDLRSFIKTAREIKKSLGKYEKQPQNCELAAIPAMRKGVIAARNLKSGQVLTEEDLMFARPATEFSSNEIGTLIGKLVKQDILQGYLIPKGAV
jgi:N,N'-diacetyllegionaminate synthase